MSRDYGAVLERVKQELCAHREVVGILLTGSYLVPTRQGPRSDLDLVVLIDGDWRQRVTRLVDTLQVETFFNPPAQVHRAFDEEPRGQMLTMFAQGRPLYDPHGTVGELVQEATKRYAEGPPAMSQDELARLRFFANDLLDDASDVLGSGSPVAQVVMLQALELLLNGFFRWKRRWPPKTKNLSRDLAPLDPTLDGMLRKFLEEFGMQRKYIVLREIANYVLDPVGGLTGEYESEREPVAS